MHPSKGASSDPECLKINYQVGKVIGTGKFAVVKECIERSSKKKYALKVVQQKILKEDYKLVRNEVVMLKATKHQNIISLHQEILTDTCHYLVIEFANNGDLFELISEQGSFSEHDVSHMVNDVIGGVTYLHSLNICHRDIKPENILVHRLGLSRAYHSYTDLSKLGDDHASSDDKHHGSNACHSFKVDSLDRISHNNHKHPPHNDHNAFAIASNGCIPPPTTSHNNHYTNNYHNNDNNIYNDHHHHNTANDNNDFSQQNYSINNDIILKIADFGLATYATETLHAMCGTPAYVAPEVVAETGYGLKVDVWSTGVLAYILLCGFPPFDSELDDQEELFEHILKSEADLTSVDWEGIGTEAKQLVASMLLKDPEARPTARQVYDHPWVKRHRDSQTASSSGKEERVEKVHDVVAPVSDDATMSEHGNKNLHLASNNNSPIQQNSFTGSDIHDVTLQGNTSTTTSANYSTTTTISTTNSFSIGSSDSTDDAVLSRLDSLSMSGTDDDPMSISNNIIFNITSNNNAVAKYGDDDDDDDGVNGNDDDVVLVNGGDNDDDGSSTISSIASTNTTLTANASITNDNMHDKDEGGGGDDDDDDNKDDGVDDDHSDDEYEEVGDVGNHVKNHKGGGADDDDVSDGNENDACNGNSREDVDDDDDDGVYDDVCESFPDEYLMEIADDDDVAWFDAERGDKHCGNKYSNHNSTTNISNSHNGSLHAYYIPSSKSSNHLSNGVDDALTAQVLPALDLTW